MEFINCTKEEVLEELTKLQPFSVAFHRDADGVTSAVLLRSVFSISTVYSPTLFGDYKDEQVSVDVGQPLSPFSGIAIDHHTHTPPFSYKLVYDTVPACLIVYELLKDRIPKEELWKLAVGLVGDGRLDLIPQEIWDSYPVLLEERASLFKSYGEIKLYSYLLVSLLPSPINALCRIGNPIKAYNVLKEAKEPDEILEDPSCKEATKLLTQEEDNIIKSLGSDRERNIFIIGGRYLLVPIQSKFWMASRIASLIKESVPKYTVIVINTGNGEISVRGELSLGLAEKMKAKGFTMGGHPGYVGGNLKPQQDFKLFLKTLREVV